MGAATPAARTPPWATAVTVLAVVGAAHVGLFLLLTASARREVGVILERHGAAALAAAVDPGAAPAAGEQVPAWARAQRLWEDAQRYEERRRYVALLGYALLGAFLVQVGITAVLLTRASDAGRRRRA